jgi:hypothetical protein
MMATGKRARRGMAILGWSWEGNVVRHQARFYYYCYRLETDSGHEAYNELKWKMKYELRELIDVLMGC